MNEQTRLSFKPSKLIRDESLQGAKFGVAKGDVLSLSPAVYELITRAESQQELNHILDHLPIKKTEKKKSEDIMISMSRGMIISLTKKLA